MRPFNKSIFQMKGNYKDVFNNLDQDSDILFQMKNLISGNKIKYYKIRYHINLLPLATYKNGKYVTTNDFLEVLVESDNLDIFDTKVV